MKSPTRASEMLGRRTRGGQHPSAEKVSASGQRQIAGLRCPAPPRRNLQVLPQKERSMKVAIYARVSTSDGRQHAENQVDELTAWAARLGHEVHRVYCDRITGTKGAEDRPALAEALRDAHERRYDVLLCNNSSDGVC